MHSILVLMSTYNGEKYLREQIDSILSQINVNVDLLIRDDGSQDNTTIIIEEYVKVDKRVKLIKGNNINWMHSFWFLVNMAKDHDYYAFSDQDDIWDKDKLIRAIEVLDSLGDTPKIYCANQRIVDSDLNVIPNARKHVDASNFEFQDYLVWGNLFRGCTEVWNNKLQDYILSKQIKDIDEPHDLVIMQICLAIGKIVKDNREVMSYRQHADNVLGSKHGLSYFIEKMKFIFSAFFGKQKKVFSNRCRKIYTLTKNDISLQKIQFYEEICNYDKSFVSALKLAFNKKYKNITRCKRIEILFRIF